MGTIAAREPTDAGVRLLVDPGDWPERPAPGDSVAVAGVCLTLAAPLDDRGRLAFDVIPETLGVTTLGDLALGDTVNLEASLRVGQTMGGHFVQGHVDGMGETVLAGEVGDEYRVRIRPPRAMLPLLATKGSVAIDGVSLTIALTREDWFEVALIPTTLRDTTLGRLAAGDRVNLESDMIARSVLRAMQVLQGGERP
jgi:riboflavin synthase alpha subunit